MEEFYICIHQGYRSVIFFTCGVLVWLCYRGDVGIICVWGCSLLFSFWKSFRRVGDNSYLFGGIHQWNHLVLSRFLLKGFWLLSQYSYLAVHIFYVFPNSILVDCVFLVVYLFLLGDWVCWNAVSWRGVWCSVTAVVTAPFSCVTLLESSLV